MLKILYVSILDMLGTSWHGHGLNLLNIQNVQSMKHLLMHSYIATIL